MSEKSLAYRLGIYIFVSVLLLFGIIIGWSYRHLARLTRENVEIRAYALSEKIVEPVNQKIQAVQSLASAIAGQVPLYNLNNGVEDIFTVILQKNPFVEFIRVCLPLTNRADQQVTWMVARQDSQVLFSYNPQPAFACINMELLDSRFLQTKKAGWSVPQRCPKKGSILSVYYYPVLLTDTGKLQSSGGYVACALSLDFLQREIEKIRIGDKGYAFLFSSEGIYITHPLKEMVMDSSFYTQPRKVFRGKREEITRYLAGESGPIKVNPLQLDYKKAWAIPRKIPETNWILSFVIPWSELTNDIRRVLFRMGAISLLVSVLLFLLVFLITGRLIHPVSKMTNQLHRFSNRKASTMQPPANEAVSLQKSLERLRQMEEEYLKQEEESNQRRAFLLAELELASEIQRSIIPPPGNHLLFDRKVAVFTVFRPAQTVSGDLYDFFMIDSHRMLITIGDVSGGSVPAALFMGVAHTFIKTFASTGTAKSIVKKINNELCRNNRNQFFLTLFLGILDCRMGILNYCNAGHIPSFIVSENGHITELGDPHGLPPGLYCERDYTDASIPVRKNDLLILHTDGVTDQSNEAGEFFGAARLRSLLAQLRDRTPEEASNIILRSVDDFSKGSTPTDDLSLMVMKYQEPWLY